jgi:hypothetical protein
MRNHPSRHLLNGLFVVIAAFTYASAQTFEKGRVEDLTGISRVYISTSSANVVVIEAIHKKLPQITFVSSRDEAEVWLEYSAQRDTERDSNPGLSERIDSRPTETIIHILRSQGKIIRLAGSNPARLVKKVSGTGKASDGNRLARDFAEEFIKLYSEANPGSRQPDTKQAPAFEKGSIEDLKGGTTLYVGAPDHYSSFYLQKIVETIRKEIPGLVIVSDRDADIWLLFDAEGTFRDSNVQGRIIRNLGQGRLRLVKEYSGKGSAGADHFVKEFIKSYRKVNPVLN